MSFAHGTAACLVVAIPTSAYVGDEQDRGTGIRTYVGGLFDIVRLRPGFLLRVALGGCGRGDDSVD
jgi:hypothetical protein